MTALLALGVWQRQWLTKKLGTITLSWRIIDFENGQVVAQARVNRLLIGLYPNKEKRSKVSL